MENKQGLGFTLTELLIVVAIVGILASLAVPSFQEQFKIRRVKGATAALFGALQNAKAEAVKTNEEMRIVFTPSSTGTEHSTWCYGMTQDADGDGSIDTTCDCTAASTASDGCAAGSIVKSTEYKDIRINFNFADSRLFTPLRGTGTSGTVTLSVGPASDNMTLGVRTSGIGRIRICKVAGSSIFTSSGACT